MHSATTLPLHGGKAPRWLFHRMVKLGGAISNVIIEEFGPDELLLRLSDSNWFQALSCAIGYDWHSSGTTTVTMGALKEALNGSSDIYIAGGKGKAGTRTPLDIVDGTDALSMPGRSNSFVEFSRLSAKIDSSLVYDDIGIYHHCFAFSRTGKWAVVQQAMQGHGDLAVRFQWFSDCIDAKDIANEPHASIETRLRAQSLDMTSNENAWARSASVEALHEHDRIVSGGSFPHRHDIVPQIDISKRGMEAIRRAGELDPKDYKELLLVKGVGRATLRSLAFVSSLIYGKELAYRDPITYAYNLGGKDGIPFPVDKPTYDSVVESLNHVIDAANVGKDEKYKALRRLASSMAAERV